MPEATEQAPGTEATTADIETPPKAKGGSNQFVKIGIFVAIGMVAVVAAYFVTLNVVKPMMAPTAAVSGEEVVAAEPVAEVEEAPAEGEHGGGHSESAAAEENSEFFSFESIVVNPAGTAGTRFLSCSVSFQLPDGKAHKVFESAEVQIKDLLITILSSKTVDELSDIDSRNKMRREILGAVNHMIAPTTAKAVYLVDFVLQ
ncbi:MAG: flagellar basal body-associated FliL family protein [bacterium]